MEYRSVLISLALGIAALISAKPAYAGTQAYYSKCSFTDRGLDNGGNVLQMPCYIFEGGNQYGTFFNILWQDGTYTIMSTNFDTEERIGSFNPVVYRSLYENPEGDLIRIGTLELTDDIFDVREEGLADRLWPNDSNRIGILNLDLFQGINLPTNLREELIDVSSEVGDDALRLVSFFSQNNFFAVAADHLENIKLLIEVIEAVHLLKTNQPVEAAQTLLDSVLPPLPNSIRENLLNTIEDIVNPGSSAGMSMEEYQVFLQELESQSLRTPDAQANYTCISSTGLTTQLEASFYHGDVSEPYSGEAIINVNRQVYRLPRLVGNAPAYGNDNMTFGIRGSEAWLTMMREGNVDIRSSIFCNS